MWYAKKINKFTMKKHLLISIAAVILLGWSCGNNPQDQEHYLGPERQDCRRMGRKDDQVTYRRQQISGTEKDLKIHHLEAGGYKREHVAG
jgi:hypothetical protein